MCQPFTEVAMPMVISRSMTYGTDKPDRRGAVMYENTLVILSFS